jgi:hypothetical protein
VHSISSKPNKLSSYIIVHNRPVNFCQDRAFLFFSFHIGIGPFQDRMATASTRRTRSVTKCETP